MSTLRLHFLGAPRLTRDDQPVELTIAKAIALLAYLAVTRTPQTRERIQDLLWPESSAEAGRKNLRNLLWTIRKTLGETVVRADDDRLTLHESVWVDVREFEPMAVGKSQIADSTAAIRDLQSAISQYSGPFLDGLNLDDAPDFEVWLTAERERLGQLYLRALATLIELYRVVEQWSEIISLANRALAYDNLHEPMYRVLMEAHGRLGERAEALRLYDNLRSTLDRELGVEPLQETEVLRAAILSGEFQSPPSPLKAGKGSHPGGDQCAQKQLASRSSAARPNAKCSTPNLGQPPAARRASSCSPAKSVSVNRGCGKSGRMGLGRISLCWKPDVWKPHRRCLLCP